MQANKEIKVELISKNSIDTSNNIQAAVESGEALEFSTVNNQYQRKSLFLQVVEFGEGNFERVSDWMRFVNKLNKYDDGPIVKILTGKTKSSDWGDIILTREDIDYSEDGISIEFKEPQQIVIEEIQGNYVVAIVKKIKGKITYEWLHSKRHREQLKGYAGICEIHLYDVEIAE